MRGTGRLFGGDSRCRSSTADRELPVSVLDEPIRARNDHCADRIRALDVAIVVDFNAVERTIKAKGCGDAVEQLALRCALGEAAAECLARRKEDAAHELSLVTAPRHRKPHPLAAKRQSLLHQLLLDQLMTEQNERGFGAIVVELPDERSQHFLDGELAVVAREISPVAPILASSEEEDLHASLAAGVVRSNHIRIDNPWHVDFLMALDERQGSDAVSDQRRRFEIQNFSRALHLGRQSLLHVVASTGKENACLIDQRRVVLLADAAYARSAASLDLMQQARARSSCEHAVAAGSQEKCLLQGYQGTINRSRRGKWSEVAAVLGSRPTVFGQLWELMTGAEVNKRKRLVVPQQHVVARHQPLDHVAFEQQRFRFGVGDDDLDRGGFSDHAPQSARQPEGMSVVLNPTLQI